MEKTDLEEKPYFKYWGKARSQDETGPAYHLLPYHCLDVAAVGYLLLSPDKPLCRRLARQLQVNADWLRNFFVFCLALHDLGKFSRSFQGLQEGLSSDLVKPNPRMPYNERHDSLGFWVWDRLVKSWLMDNFPFSGLDDIQINTWLRYCEPWLEIVTGHHGIPPKKGGKRLADFFKPDDEQAVLIFVEEIFNLLLPSDFDCRPLLDKALKKRLASISWQLAGVAVLADWLGSNQNYFIFQSVPEKLSDYWRNRAGPTAKKAVQALPEAPEITTFKEANNLFPFIKHLTPLQDFAVNVVLPNKPQLMVLEDVTGAGKTEAALILSHRLMTQGLADGLYVALPTMATANAMYQRVGRVYRKFYQQNSLPSLVLAHGACKMSEDFQRSIIWPVQLQPDEDYLHGRDESEKELSASTYCSSWLADSRKKALLADVGVGTLDQALLAVLPVRHQSLRLLGLNGKILLVDEVHAYDSYMQKLLNALLEVHASQGGSAILLSATLPQAMRQNLVSAFHKGLGEDAPEVDDKSYPLITQTPAIKKIEHPVDTRDTVKRTVSVQRLASEQDVIEKIIQTVESGQCLCWIRNTVKTARQSYQYLLDAGFDDAQICLFHSRFAMQDRQVTEEQVLACFGKDSTSVDRKGQILIATQVVEQSLDLDFDIMISDLAPIDLLIQRAGRLQRHVRDRQGNRLLKKDASDQRGIPVLILFSPEPTPDADANWLKPEHAGTQAVYPHIGQLWLTAKILLSRKQNKFSMPDDARNLIEGVYSIEAEAEIPDGLQEASYEAEGINMVQKSMADLNVLKLDKGYTQNSGDWDEETRIPTRLTEQETVSVALVVWDGETLQPYANHPHYTWALSTVKIPEYEWEKARQAIPESLKAPIEQLQTETKGLRWLEVFPICTATRCFYNAKDGWLSDTGDNT